MNEKTVFEKALDRLAACGTGATTFGELECAVFKTMMILAAVDGSVSPLQFETLRRKAADASGLTADAFADIWRDALHHAGYIAIQARLLRKDALVVEFMREADDLFVRTLSGLPRVRWTRAFDCLNAIAAADGNYSEAERACVNALVKRLTEIGK